MNTLGNYMYLYGTNLHPLKVNNWKSVPFEKLLPQWQLFYSPPQGKMISANILWLCLITKLHFYLLILLYIIFIILVE